MNEIFADVSVLRILMMGATWPYVDVVAAALSPRCLLSSCDSGEAECWRKAARSINCGEAPPRAVVARHASRYRNWTQAC